MSQSTEGDIRKLANLRVVDLRAELEKRGLDKNGVKAQLIERLTKALKDDGEDPEVYEFEKPKRILIKPESESDTSTVIEEAEKNDEYNRKDLQSEKDSDDNKGNGIDNEDSLNLTIEEDEDQLLTDDIDDSHRSMEIDDTKDAPDVEDEPQEDAGPETTEKTIGSTKEKEELGGADGETNAASADAKADVGAAGADPKTTSSMTDGPESSTTTTAPTSRIRAAAESDSGSASTAPKTDKDAMGSTSTAGRSLWVAGLATITRATDLKQLLSRYGKVVGAKVVTNARMPSARCYGYVVMATVEDAENCIKYAHRTELHGRFITIDKARSEKTDTSKVAKEKKENEVQKCDKLDSSSDYVNTKLKADDKVNSSFKSDCDKSICGEKKSRPSSKDGSVKRDDKKSLSKERDRSRHNSERSGHIRDKSKEFKKDNSRERRRRSTSKGHGKGVLSLKQIIEERDRQRLRERERILREAEQRRRREEQARTRELDRKHKKESKRLERERERLRVERERLQREKADLIRLERKRLEQELFELRERKMEVVRRAQKRTIPDAKDSFVESRKRINTGSSNEYDAPPSAERYEMPSRSNAPPEAASKKREQYKRDDYEAREEYKQREIDVRSRDARGPRDDYKPREEYTKTRDDPRGREEVRSRDDQRSREEYSKRDRPDFPPPPPRISGPAASSKYESSDARYSGPNRPSRDTARREPMPPGAASSVRNSYRDRSSGQNDARSPPPGGPYRTRDDDSRRSDPDRRANKDSRPHDGRYSDLPPMKGTMAVGTRVAGRRPAVGRDGRKFSDYSDRDPSGWRGPSGMKSFGSMSGPGGSSRMCDPWIKNDVQQISSSGQWANSTPRMESSDRWMSTPPPRMMSGPSGLSYGSGGSSSGLLPPGVSTSSYLSDQRYDSHKSSLWVLR